MRAVNLLPDPHVEKRTETEDQGRAKTSTAIAIAAAVAFVLLAVVIGHVFMQGRSDVSDRKATLAGLQAQVAQVQGAAAVSAAAASAAQAHLTATQAHLAAVTSAASGRIAWDSLLDQLSRVMPRGAWLQSIQTTPAVASTTSTTPDSSSTSSTGSAVVTSNGLQSSGATTPAAAATFTVTGFARSQKIVARTLERLALISALSDVALQSTSRTDVSGKPAIQFTIGANVRSAGGNG